MNLQRLFVAALCTAAVTWSSCALSQASDRNAATPADGWAAGWKYEGQTVDGIPRGAGVATSPNGIRFEGEFAGFRLPGRARALYPNGSVYEGDIDHMGRGNGKGTFVSADRKTTYTGDYVGGQPQGVGRYEFANGQTYVGEFAQGNQNGQGVQTFPSGERQEGRFADGQAQGHGVHTWPDGRRYEGEFAGGKVTGRGTLVYASGERHEGNFVEGAPSGRGSHSWPDGRRFDGEYANGQPNGRGTFVAANGRRWRGTFKEGRLTAAGACIAFVWIEDAKYEGECKDGVAQGQGRLDWWGGNADASMKNYDFRYVGAFERGMFNGPGRLEHRMHTMFEGAVFYVQEGTFVDGALEGQGTFKDVVKGLSWTTTYVHGLSPELDAALKEAYREESSDWGATLFQGAIVLAGAYADAKAGQLQRQAQGPARQVVAQAVPRPQAIVAAKETDRGTKGSARQAPLTFLFQIPLEYRQGDTSNANCWVLVSVPGPAGFLESNDRGQVLSVVDAYKSRALQKCGTLDRRVRGDASAGFVDDMPSKLGQARAQYDRQAGQDAQYRFEMH